ncbi:MAG: flagellar basal body-associated protein FliL [Paracoccaceae bacterium]
MSKPAEPAEDAPPKKRGKLPLILGLVLMPALGAVGFFAVSSGLILAPEDPHAAEEAVPLEPMPDVAFVPVDQIILSLSDQSGGRHLRFSSQIEVAKGHEEEVRLLLPRIVDVMNGYLRAVDIREFEAPAALVRLRANITRRVRLVAGEARVRDVLVTEFVIN